MHLGNSKLTPNTFIAIEVGKQCSGGLTGQLLKILMIFLLSLVVTYPAVAQIETVLHSFNGNDGAYPFSRLTIDARGNLYGTTGGTLPLQSALFSS